jgi:hypothetical protein
MTLQYAAERGECCSACNPLELVQLRTCVARITGPGGVEIRLCVRCLDALMMLRPEVNVFERQGVPRIVRDSPPELIEALKRHATLGLVPG